MKHHYIPEFYSKQWATGDDRKVLRYRRLPSGLVVPKRLAPAAFGYRDDLYRAPYEDQRRAQALELRFFSRLDNAAAKALAVLTDVTLPTLPERAVGIWAHFILSLLHRSPAYFESVQRAGTEHYKIALQDLRERYNDLRKESDPETFEEYVDTLDASDPKRSVFQTFPRLVFNRNILDYMGQMTWFSVDADDSCPTLLLSDDPVTRTNGLHRPDGHLAIPLSPTRMLVGTHTPEFADHLHTMRRKDLFRGLNESTVGGAREFVAAIDGRQERFIQKRFGRALRNALAGA